MSKILERQMPEADINTLALQSGGPRWKIIEQGRPKYLLPENNMDCIRERVLLCCRYREESWKCASKAEPELGTLDQDAAIVPPFLCPGGFDNDSAGRGEREWWDRRQ